jgi:hypothetical protein
MGGIYRIVRNARVNNLKETTRESFARIKGQYVLNINHFKDQLINAV